MSELHGFIEDMDEREYHAHPTSLSVSGAKQLLKAPALFKHQQANPVHSDVFDFGSAAHALVLGTGPKLYVVEADSWRSKVAQEARDAARENGEVPLLAADHDRVCAMADAISQHTMAMRLLGGGKPEVSAFAPDRATGVLRRCRFDYLQAHIGVDYKSTVSAEPDAFASSCAKYGYHQQQAWYTDLAADLGQPLDAFVFIAQEKTAPYLVSVIELDDRAVQRGRELNARALEMFRDCTESGIWPGYTTDRQFTRVSLPRWAFYDNDNELQEIA